jgi:FMN reductase
VASAAKDQVLAADLLVVASPVFKASFTGLLKLFLDHFDAGELAGKPTVALMLGGSAAHTLVGEVHLKPVLNEIGASCPTPALYLIDTEWDTSPALETWLPRAQAALLP